MSAKKNDNIKKAAKAPVKAPVKAAAKASGKTTTKTEVKAATKKAPVKKAAKPATSSARRARPATSSARRPEPEYVISKAAYQRSWKYIVDINSASKERLDRVALIDMERTYTYRQMFRNWEKYAEVFSALGITEANHSRLAIFDCSCIESSFAVYAANMTGSSIAGFTPAYLSEKFPLSKAIKEEGITDLFRVEFYSNLCNPQHKNYEHSYKPDYQKFIVMIRFLNHFFFFIFINIIFHFSTSFLLSLF